jgi:excisionase family DNA binding protein
MRHGIYAIGMANVDPITVKQAAEILDCREAHVRLLIARGRIDARLFSRVYLVDAQSVARYLKHGRCPHMGRPRKTRRRKTR